MQKEGEQTSNFLQHESDDQSSPEIEYAPVPKLQQFCEIAGLVADAKLTEKREVTDPEKILLLGEMERAITAVGSAPSADIIGKDLLQKTLDVAKLVENIFPDLQERNDELKRQINRKLDEFGRVKITDETDVGTIRPENELITLEIPESEYEMFTSRSGGHGGQNVNKLETKVGLRFKVADSKYLSEKEKGLVREMWRNQINDKDELVIASQEERTQEANRRLVKEKLHDMLRKALRVDAERIATEPTHSSQIKRVDSKRIEGKKKAERREKADY
jgi:ribosome-associated protein